MKLKHFLLAVLAGAATAVACGELSDDIIDGVPTISIDPATLSFESGEGSNSIKLTSSLKWSVTTDLSGSWVALGLTSGEKGKDQVISVSVDANTDDYDREMDIVFALSQNLSKVTLHITQKGPKGTYTAEEGDGSQERPFNVAQIKEAVANLSYTDNTNYDKIGPYYVKGKISSIKEAFGEQFGNANFNISDDGTESGPVFTAYRVLFLENKKWVNGYTQINVGDIAVVYGEVMNFKGNTPETVANKGYLYSLNGETVAKGGQVIDYENAPASTIADFIAAGENGTYYKLTGTVSSFKSQYCSFDLTDSTGKIYIYSVDDKDTWVSKISDGATVVLVGKFKLYTDKNGNTKNEIEGAHILSCEGGTPVDEGEAKGDGTLASPYNPKAAKDLASALASGAKSDEVYVQGKIASIKYTFSAQYGTATFDISEDGTTSGALFSCYSVLYLNNRAWVDGDTQVAVGDDVIIYGKLTNYNGTPETASKEAYIYSLNGVTDGGEVEEPDYENAPAATVADFIAKADTENYYKLSGTVSNFNSSYSSFDLTDESGTIYVYSVANKSEWAGKIKNEATIVLAGLFKLYNDAPEVVNAHILSCEGGVDDPDPQGGDFSTNISWELGTNAYSEKATVNGVADVPVLKLGKGTAAGTATLTLPAGSTKLTFYALSWNGKPSALTFKSGDTTVGTVEPAANSGLANTQPYTLTVTDSDIYTIEFAATTTLTVEVSHATNFRAAIFGAKAE